MRDTNIYGAICALCFAVGEVEFSAPFKTNMPIGMGRSQGSSAVSTLNIRFVRDADNVVSVYMNDGVCIYRHTNVSAENMEKVMQVEMGLSQADMDHFGDAVSILTGIRTRRFTPDMHISDMLYVSQDVCEAARRYLRKLRDIGLRLNSERNEIELMEDGKEKKAKQQEISAKLTKYGSRISLLLDTQIHGIMS